MSEFLLRLVHKRRQRCSIDVMLQRPLTTRLTAENTGEVGQVPPQPLHCFDRRF